MLIVADTEPEETVIVTVPIFIIVNNPSLLIVAILELLLDH